MEIIIDDTDEIISINKLTVVQYNVAQINSIQYKYKELRNKGKAPVFALT